MSPMRSLFLACPALIIGFLACSSDGGDAAPPVPGGGASSGTPGSSGDDPTNPPIDDRTSTDGGADAAPKPTYKHFDINHVLSTGASDSVANGATPVITTAQTLGNLSFDVGVMTGRGRPNFPDRACDGTGCTRYETPADFKDLVEGDSFLGYGVETMSAGLANQASVFANAWFPKAGLPATGHTVLVSLHGRSGAEYWCLRKGDCYNTTAAADPVNGYINPFDEAMRQVTSAKAIAMAKNKTYVVRAVTAIHGQGDSDDNETMLRTLVMRTDGSGQLIGNYTNALIEWQRDYETEIRKITGQTEPVPLFVSQFGSFTAYRTSIIPVRQLAAHVQAPGKVVVVTPNYPFDHADDCNHYTNHGQRRLGAYFAKAYQRVVIEGGVWEPLRPLSITREGTVLTVKYFVPVPPMVVDTTRVRALDVNPQHLGFTYEDSTTSAAITGVELLPSGDTVRVTLSNAPTGANRKLRYAQNMDPSNNNRCPGRLNGTRGNLRDSDATVSHHTDGAEKPYELFNWAVQADLDVP